ncbi:Ger(x)C family spore germination protein [Ectobacillus ponti]|uniref:Ger(X)C family spore germination protein n=1 Tax=Ectobacillus ponti TaxID=2961894 RepID=A0AA41XBG9_9BACI|nr:Ger(x)C family spore germination protein [Ectobacillus ponti]MCP8968971.1 Ger(x)C family spore germination protein [Ectobacillus ponti]
MKRAGKGLLVLLSAVLCTGCIIKTRPLEQLGLATAVGIDKGKGDKLKGVVVLHHFGTKPEDVAQQLTSTAYTGRGLTKFMNLETSDRLVSGQLRIAVYGKDYATERGITEHVEALKRDASTQTNMYLAISKTTAKDILYQSKGEEHSKNIGTYLYKMIEQNIREDEMISCTVQEFLRDYYLVGRDIVLPLLEKRRDYVLIDGAALVHRGKYVTNITADEAFYIKALREGYKGGSQKDLRIPLQPLRRFYPQKDPDKYVHINLEQIGMKQQITLSRQRDPVFDVYLQTTVSISALTKAIDLGKPGVYTAFEQEIEKELARNFKLTMKRMQEHSIDPVGFGAIYDTSIRHLTLTERQWYDELYPKAKFRFHVKVAIARSGVLN